MQVAGRFVGKHKTWFVRQRPRNGNTLLLPA